MHIYAFSGIFRHNHTYSEIIQVYSDISRILCKLSIFRISVYSEPLNEPKAYSKSWSEPKAYSELCILITRRLVKQENIFRKKGYHLFSTLLTHSNVVFLRVCVCVFLHELVCGDWCEFLFNLVGTLRFVGHSFRVPQGKFI